MTYMHKLYIFMRSDLDSLNPGKAMAQAVHAGNQLESRYQRVLGNPEHNKFINGFNNWKNQAYGFGTTIVLDADEFSDRLKDIAEWLEIDSLQPEFGVILDPSYPLIDGNKVHLIALDTCAYLFDHGQLQPPERTILETFRLYK